GTAIPRRCINCLAWYSWIFKIDLRDAAAWAALAGSPSITGARARPARADTDRHRPAAAHDRETYLGYRVGPVAALGRRVGGGTPGSARRRPLVRAAGARWFGPQAPAHASARVRAATTRPFPCGPHQSRARPARGRLAGMVRTAILT